MLEYLEIGDLVLENGTLIRNVRIAYNVYGNIERRKKLFGFVTHFANSDAETWWPGNDWQRRNLQYRKSTPLFVPMFWVLATELLLKVR